MAKVETISCSVLACFRVSDYLSTGTTICNYCVTYVGKSCMKHFCSIEETGIPDTIPDNYMYYLIEIIKMGAYGPGIFNGYTNPFYKQAPAPALHISCYKIRPALPEFWD